MRDLLRPMEFKFLIAWVVKIGVSSGILCKGEQLSQAAPISEPASGALIAF
jgi:hypothetical protein